MEINKKNVSTILIHSDHDKICILEKYLRNDSILESLVSNFIDTSLQKQTTFSIEIFNKLKNNIKNDNLFNNIIELSICIINQTPYQINIENNDKNSKYIHYLKRFKTLQSLS